jgi:hypothetical protein
MKKPIFLSLIIAVLFGLSSFAEAQSQNPADEEKPTFYRLIPGVYVNGWPRFTIHYPKDWVERRPMPQETFRVSAPGPVPSPALIVAPFAGPFLLSLEAFASFLAKLFQRIATEVTVVSDKPSRLRDGSSAREVEHQMILNGAPCNTMSLVTKKGDLWVNVAVESRNGKIGEDLKAILYSIDFEPGKDELVKVPPDVQEFLDSNSNAWISHDIAKVKTLYSDRYLNSGERKGEAERRNRGFIGFVTSFEYSITDFITAGDRVYLTGFVSINLGRTPLKVTSIIKENGEWKWYGNQRDVSP